MLSAAQMNKIDDSLYEILGVAAEVSPNLWNITLSSSDLEDSYYHLGVPYTGSSAETINAGYHATPKIYLSASAPKGAEFVIEMETEKSYVFHAIPTLSNGYAVPWGAASSKIHFYDSSDGYLGSGNVSANTVTVPSNTAYFRFNIAKGSQTFDGIVTSLNTRLMVLSASVEIPSTYLKYGWVTETPIGIVPRLQEDFYSMSPNLWNITLTTANLSGKYYFSGSPYDTSTQFDVTHQATGKIYLSNSAPKDAELVIEMQQGHEYCFYSASTLSNGYTTPWNPAINSTIMFYDGSDNYIGNGEASSSASKNIVTVPSAAAYFRFNITTNVSGSFTAIIDSINSKLMVVDTTNELPDVYIGYGVLSKKTITADNVLETRPIFYNFEDEVVDVISHYNKEYDMRYNLKKKGPNNIFDYNSFNLVPVLASGEVSNNLAGTALNSWGGTDSHGPFIIYANENADGDNLNDNGSYKSYFTGGNHDYNNTGTGGDGLATGRTAVLRLYADGHEIESGSGYCNQVKLYWENYVQGYNTTKSDGTGREILRECHESVFDGYEWKEEIQLRPLEDITATVYYGIQCIGCGSFYTTCYYMGAIEAGANRAPTALGVSSNSGSATTNKYVAFNDSHSVELEIDRTYDMGAGWMNDISYNLFSTTSKAYFNIIRGSYTLYKDCVYGLRVFYRWKPIME